MLVLCLTAVSVTPGFTECIKGDCRNGDGVFVSKDGRKYSGQFVRGMATGQGQMIFPNGV